MFQSLIVSKFTGSQVGNDQRFNISTDQLINQSTTKPSPISLQTPLYCNPVARLHQYLE
jgi:hypothetical protein